MHSFRKANYCFFIENYMETPKKHEGILLIKKEKTLVNNVNKSLSGKQ